MTAPAPVPAEAACDECHRLFNVATGEIVPEWADVYHVVAGPLLCGRCKAAMIEVLEGQVLPARAKEA